MDATEDNQIVLIEVRPLSPVTYATVAVTDTVQIRAHEDKVI